MLDAAMARACSSVVCSQKLTLSSRQIKSTRSGSSGRSMSDRHGATRKFRTWQGSRRKRVVVAPKGLLYGLPARPAALKDLDDGLLQVAGLSLRAPARKGLAMFAVQVGSNNF